MNYAKYSIDCAEVTSLPSEDEQVHFRQEAVAMTLNEDNHPLDEGSILLTNKFVYWQSGPCGDGKSWVYRFPYNFFALHAINKAEGFLYCEAQFEETFSDADDSEEDEEEKQAMNIGNLEIKSLKFLISDSNILEGFYTAFQECNALNPDPDDSDDEEEGDGEDFYNDEQGDYCDDAEEKGEEEGGEENLGEKKEPKKGSTDDKTGSLNSSEDVKMQE
eukprot:CAMPEP_0115025010 /NCGR_PEP_ID=MMETSP0216-20121206/33685_1 /TAXON_ID=223996 /ORGANISM="Protocruzia adherens, Strain Boccale" /LENGTH=217 /DNA_ID=CAMNT_0002399391 /DNA_START=18 /DNA_END=671 /DNA_ORIENTATION=-